MLRVNAFDKNELDILEQHYRESGTRLIRERAHAVLLSVEGRSPPDVAKIVRRSEHTVRGWIRAFNESRIASVFPQYTGNNNAGKLTKEQREEIKQVLKQPPNVQGIPKEFWTVGALRRYVKASFGIVYESERSYHFLLHLSRLSFKLPSPFDFRRDDEFVERRMAEIREKIKPFLQNPRWAVLVSDESRIVWESEIRRAWLKKGSVTVVKVHRSNEYQNFIGMLNLQTGTSYLYELGWQNQQQIIGALKKLKRRYPRKRICLIWDNARWHKGALIRKELSAQGMLSRFHLVNLPPYAPDKNPQERIWKDAKEKISNRAFESFEMTKRAFRRAVLGKTYDYKL